jgi:hypothetical protein
MKIVEHGGVACGTTNDLWSVYIKNCLVRRDLSCDSRNLVG